MSNPLDFGRPQLETRIKMAKQLKKLIKMAKQLGFEDDVKHWQEQLDELDAQERENNG